MPDRHKERRDALRRLWRLGAAGLASGAGLSGCALWPGRDRAPAPPPVTVPPPPAEPVAPPLPPVPPPAPKPPRIGLALGGGAARGFAHIGVIQVLEEAGFKVDLVTGTSAGSLVAALWAAGRSGNELAELADQMDEYAFADWAYPTRGLIRGEALARFVREKTGRRAIEDMRIPLGIAATDLGSGDGILFRRGDTGTAVRASSAVPAVFQPVKIGTREYVDGGLSAPVPVRHARDMGAGLVVAVDISQVAEGQPTSDLSRMLLQTFTIMGRSLKAYELKEADVVVTPMLRGVSGTDFALRRQTMRAGREAMQGKLAELKAKVARLSA